MRLFAFAALALLMLAAPAAAQERSSPETCTYRDNLLAAECRADPGLRNFLIERENRWIENWEDLPPVMRGWAPGEEAAVIGAISAAQGARGGMPAPRTPPSRGYSTWTFPPPANPNESLSLVSYDEQQFLLQGVTQVLIADTGADSVDVVRASAYVLQGHDYVTCGRAIYRRGGESFVGSFIIHPTQGVFANVTADAVSRWCDRADVRLR